MISAWVGATGRRKCIQKRLQRYKELVRSGRDPLLIATLASVQGLAGRKHEAVKLIAELKERSRQHYISNSLFAEAYIGLAGCGKRGSTKCGACFPVVLRVIFIECGCVEGLVRAGP